MYVVIFSSLICLFLTYLDSIGKFRKGLSFSFVLLGFLAAVHYDYGNDYMPYYELYGQLTYYPFDYKSIIDGDYKDYGWAFLCYIFKPFGGFFTMVAVLSIIQNYIVYKFIRREVKRTWWTMSVFIYLFITNYYLLNLSMLRQGLVVCVFLGLWTYIKNKKWWIPLIVLLLFSTIHSSAIVLIPFSFWGFLPTKNNKLLALVYGILFILLLLSSDFLNSIFGDFLMYETFEEYAELYDTNKSATFGLGYILGLIPFFLSEYYLLTTNDESENKQLVTLSMFAFMIIPFSALIPLVVRIAYYFGVFQLAAIPLVFKSIKGREVRLVIMLLWLFLNIYSYWNFFHNSIYAKSYREFRTIFEVL